MPKAAHQHGSIKLPGNITNQVGEHIFHQEKLDSISQYYFEEIRKSLLFA